MSKENNKQNNKQNDNILEFSFVIPRDKNLHPKCNFKIHPDMLLVECLGFITMIKKSLNEYEDKLYDNQIKPEEINGKSSP
jgi:hypothetical protein